jgi:hypothetical protein
MPWTVADVDSHKSGLSEKSKKQWCRIANSVLKRCIAKGGTDETCAPSAIKQANGAVMNSNASVGKYIVCKNKQILDYEPKLTVHQEKAHLVVPVVMMVEGVHNGSQGALLHTIDELGKFPDSWNGIPVVIYHPTKDDEPVSANSPEIIDTRTVGRVYNTNVEGKKLKAEVWFDEDKLNTISEDTLQAINDSKEIEVSLGMFTENEEKEGEYEGEKYVGIAHNHRPDHLAILPDQKGACSCEDGCGIGANSKNDNIVIHESIWEKIRYLGYSVYRIGKYTKQGYNELMSMIYDKLRSLDSDKTYNYLEECYDDYLIYSKSGDNKRTMYKQSYKVESGKIEFVGEPVEVHKKVEYVLNSLNINESKKEVKMPKNECPKCLAKINTLLANKESGFDETDRGWLEVLTEPQLDKAITPKVKEVEKIVEKTVEINKLTAEQTADLAFLAKQRADRKSEMIQGIQANTSKELWPDDVLKGMNEDHLKRIFDSVKKPEQTDYSLGSGGFNSNAGEEEALLPPGVVEEVKK